MYRLNTYPLIHLNFLHAFFNTLVLVPLLERFEAEHGTLLTAAMFAGRMSSLHQKFPTKALQLIKLLYSSVHPSRRHVPLDRARSTQRKRRRLGREVLTNPLAPPRS